MTTQTEALTLALEALKANQPVNYCMNNNGEKFPMMQEDPFKFDRNSKAITAIKEALAQPEQEPQKSGISGSPSDTEICNERSAQACGPVYCGNSGGYCNKCPKQKTMQDVKQCKGMNCGCIDGLSHSLECQAELAAAIAGGMFFPSVHTTPPQRKPLTLEQLREHWQVAKVLDMTDAEIDFADYVLITRDVEALHGIKE